MISISVVVPVYQEVDSVPKLHQALAAVADRTPGAWELIFVDDGSRDGTLEALCAARRADPRVRAIRLKRNFGQTPAMACGIDHARGNIGDVAILADGPDWPAFSSEDSERGVALAEVIQLFDGEADVIQDASEEPFLEGRSVMDRDSYAAAIGRSLERAVAAAPMDFLKPEPLENRDQFAGGEEREFLTAHVWRESVCGRFRQTPLARQAVVGRLSGGFRGGTEWLFGYFAWRPQGSLLDCSSQATWGRGHSTLRSHRLR